MSAPHPEEPLLVCLQDVAPRPLDYLWPGRIVRGKLCLLDGDPDQGKSLFTLDLCARLTRGAPFLDGAPGGPPANVLLLTAEDNLDDTVLPRLQHLGGDRARVFAYQGSACAGVFTRPPSFPRDAATLEKLIRKTESQLVVLDPFLTFLDATVCSLNDQALRQALLPLVRVAEQTRCVILLVRHLTKFGGGRALYRGTGGIAIMGAARTALLLACDPEDRAIHVLAWNRNNTGPVPPALAFGIVNAGGMPELLWLGESDLTADQLLLTPPADLLPRQRAREFLQQELAQGEREVGEVRRLAKAEGLSETTLRRARRQLKVRTRRQLTAEGRTLFFWSLPEAERDPAYEELMRILPPLDLSEMTIGHHDLSL